MDSGYLRGRPRFLFSPVTGGCFDGQRDTDYRLRNTGERHTLGSSDSGSDDFRFLGGMVGLAAVDRREDTEVGRQRKRSRETQREKETEKRRLRED